MSAVSITDLPLDKELDRNALAELTGRGSIIWNYRSSTTSYSGWSAQKRVYSSYQGTTIKNGYLHRHYREGWQRQRTEYKTNHWDKFVKI